MQPMRWSLALTGSFFLGLHTLTDLKERMISLRLILLQVLTGLLMNLGLHGGLPDPAAFLPGMIAFVIAHVSREALGKGDAWVLLASGLYFSAGELIRGLEGSFLLLWIRLLVTWRRRDEQEIPYIPYLMAGMIGGTWFHG